LFTLTGGFLDGLASFIDFGYKLVDGAEKIVGKIFGEEGAEKFRTFMENLKNLISGFVVFKVIKAKIIDVFIRRIKSAFKLVKGFIRRGAKLVTKLFPQLGKLGSKVITGARGLVSKGASKVGGFAAKIFGKAAGFIAPAFKTAKPFASKFFSKIPIVGPLVITIVSLLSGEPASQAIFKGLGGALGGVLGSFIPIPILGTLIGETLGVFVGDLFYELLFGKGIEGVGQKLKDTFKTFIKPIFDFFKNGFSRFIETFNAWYIWW
jgi:phage-related protein